MKTWWRAVLAVTVVVGLSARAPAAGDWQLAVTVEEPAGVTRTAAPVSGGIPLVKGAYKPGQAFALFEGGKEIPLQVISLVVDEKRGLCWVLLDAQVDLAANERKTLTLKAAKGSAAPASPCQVTEGADAVTVDTGRIEFTISKARPFSLFSSVKAGGEPPSPSPRRPIRAARWSGIR